MLETIFILLQIIGIIAFAMGVWYNFHQRTAKSAGVERVRNFFHNAQKSAGDIEVLNAGIIVAAIIALIHADYRIFAAAMGFSIIVGATINLCRKLSRVRDGLKSRFTTCFTFNFA